MAISFLVATLYVWAAFSESRTCWSNTTIGEVLLDLKGEWISREYDLGRKLQDSEDVQDLPAFLFEEGLGYKIYDVDKSNISCNNVTRLLKRILISLTYLSMNFKTINEYMMYRDEDLSLFDCNRDTTYNRKDIQDCIDTNLNLKKCKCIMMYYINDHCKQDGTHYRWFLHDFLLLNLDNNENGAVKVSDFLAFIYGKSHWENVNSIYEMIAIGSILDSKIKMQNSYFLIELVEMVAHKFVHSFAFVGDVWNEHCSASDKYEDRLQFMAHTHSSVEKGFSIGDIDEELTRRDIFQKHSITVEKSKFLHHHGISFLNTIVKLYEECFNFVHNDYKLQNVWEF